MATENIKVVKVDTGAAQTSVKELRNELKELRNTLLNTTEGTDEFNEALKQSAEIQHTLKEQMELINANAMDFGQIATNCTNAVGGMVAGFQAAKATLNLFGIENESVIKSLQQMQNLMAITQALPSIDKGVKAFKALTMAIKGGTLGLHGFKAALASTGIGLAVVAVGALAANFDKLKSWITGTNEELEKQKKLQMEEHLKKVNEQLDKRLDREKEIRKLAGQSDVEIAEERVKSIEKEIKKKEQLIEANRREEAQAWMSYQRNVDAGKAQSLLNSLKEKANAIHEREVKYQRELDDLRKKALKDAQEQLKIERENEAAREIKRKADAAERAAEEAKKKAADERKRRIEEEKKAVEELRKKYGELAEDIKLYDATDYEKDLASLAKTEQKSIKTIEDAQKKGIISKEQYEKDKLAIEKYYAKLRDNAAKEEAERQRQESIELLDTSYQLEQAKLQKQYDEKLISEKDFNDRKKELLETYVQDYVDNIQFMLDTENGLTDEQILDLTTKINEARAMLKPEETTEEDSVETKISNMLISASEAINVFADNPAWGKVMNNISQIATIFDDLNKNHIEKGSKKAFNSYAQVAGVAFAAIGTMLAGLSAEQDTSNKEGFEQAKKYQIAAATMQMFSGIAMALSGVFTTKTGPWDIALAAVQAGLIAAMAGMQIAKIKQTQFNGGGSTSAGATPNTGAVASVIAPVQYTSDVRGASIEGAIKDTKVYVTETDISNTQNKVEVTENEARY